MKSLIAALAVLALALPAAAADQAMTAPEIAATDQALARGKLIYTLDQAAWHGTDDAVAHLPKTRMAETKGWIVEPHGDNQTVTFYGLSGTRPYALYVVEMQISKVLSGHEVKASEPRDLSAVGARMVQAANAARAVSASPCGPAPFNTVIIPPAKVDDPVEVYLLTPQPALDRFPFGGHFLVTVSPEGKVVSTQPFTKACLTMPIAPKGVAGVGVSELLHPTPTEVQVFMSLSMKQPVFVITEDPEQFWQITPGEIKKMPPPTKR